MSNSHMPDKRPARRRQRFRLFRPRTKQPNFIFSVLVTSVSLLLILVLVMGMSGFGLIMGVAKAYFDTTPELDVNRIQSQSLTSFIYDCNGDLITEYRGLENRVWASYDEIPKMLRDAFVSVEDARFYTHNGIDIKRIVGAFVSNLRNESTQGGSTITQQLIKLRLLSTEQTYKRKIQEAYMAIELEDKYTKEQILEWYLNTIPLGDSNYGVRAAAKDYFDKDLDELTLLECAALAGVTRNPTKYNPRRNYYGAGKVQNTVDRTNYVLKTMYENNFISKAEYEAAQQETLHVVEHSTVNELYDMPAAVETVLYDATTALLELRGLPDTEANRKIVRNEMQTGGYNIYSTIDPVIQRIAEDTVYNWEHYPNLADASKSVSRQGAVQPQAAVAIYDYHAGELRAVVGGRTPPAQFLELNRARQSNMPVGSSIKPLAVYGPALDKGYSPATIISNLPVPIEGWNSARGYPANSSSKQHPGVVSMRHGLRSSLNTVAANAVMSLVGIEDSYNYLVSLGVDPDHINKDGFGLALGSSGITPIEMATAFGTIANKGAYQRPLTFTKITDAQGRVILDMKQKQLEDKRQVFQESTAWMLTDMLKDAVRSGTGTAAKISGMTVAGKTGTHSDYKSVYFSGYTPYYSGAVWVGHDDFESLYRGATGGKDAAPLWKAIMEKIHETYSLTDKEIIEDSPESLGLVQATVCGLSGLLVTDDCQGDEDYPPVTDWFKAGTVPTQSCNLHKKVTVCMLSGQPAGPYCPEESCTVVPYQFIPPSWGADALDQDKFMQFFPHGRIGLPDDPTLSQGSCFVHTNQQPSSQSGFQGGYPPNNYPDAYGAFG